MHATCLSVCLSLRMSAVLAPYTSKGTADKRDTCEDRQNANKLKGIQTHRQTHISII